MSKHPDDNIENMDILENHQDNLTTYESIDGSEYRSIFSIFKFYFPVNSRRTFKFILPFSTTKIYVQIVHVLKENYIYLWRAADFPNAFM